jgi:hypothetical protein
MLLDFQTLLKAKNACAVIVGIFTPTSYWLDHLPDFFFYKNLLKGGK